MYKQWDKPIYSNCLLEYVTFFMKKLFLIIPVIGVFIKCRENTAVKNNSGLIQRGDTLIARTFDTLRSSLLRAIGEKGFPGAVSFCSTEALSLTNTYTEQGITIKRTSDKLRNPANSPDALEQKILSEYKSRKQNKLELKPVLEEDAAGNNHYFKPIVLQAMCLNCHGDKASQIKPDTWEAIQKKYPNDSAFDYKEGDLRGIWHVVFSKKTK